MKVLAFSDLHCDETAAQRLVETAGDVDLVIGAGDFANCHRGLSTTLDILKQIQVPTVLVPGNSETYESLSQATAEWETAQVLHGSGCELNELPIWGVGGGIPVTPFGDWSYDFNEDQASELLRDCPTGGILVVHSPPIETVDRDGRGRSLGSTAIRDCVLRCQPQLVVCGHIHHAWGQQVTLGNSIVLNAGPLGIVIDLS